MRALNGQPPRAAGASNPRSIRRSGGLLLAAVAALFTTACGAGRGSAAARAYQGPYADQVREIIPKIEAATGLPFRTPPRLEERSSAQVREFLERRFHEERVAREQEGQVAAYKRLGLMPDTLDAQKLFLDLLTEQIVGFYDPQTKVLYVVQSAPADERSTIIGHELVHALQDQYVNLDSLQTSISENDRASAVQALIEGEAVYEQMQAVLGPGDLAARLPGGWQRIRQAVREQSSNMPLFSTAPLVLQETLIFPYLSGAEFVRRLKLDDSLPVLRHPTPLVDRAGASCRSLRGDAGRADADHAAGAECRQLGLPERARRVRDAAAALRLVARPECGRPWCRRLGW